MPHFSSFLHPLSVKLLSMSSQQAWVVKSICVKVMIKLKTVILIIFGHLVICIDQSDSFLMQHNSTPRLRNKPRVIFQTFFFPISTLHKNKTEMSTNNMMCVQNFSTTGDCSTNGSSGKRIRKDIYLKYKIRSN